MNCILLLVIIILVKVQCGDLWNPELLNYVHWGEGDIQSVLLLFIYIYIYLFIFIYIYFNIPYY